MNLDRPLILVIDDSATNLLRLQRDLSNTYEVVTAKDGLSAWELVQEKKTEIKVILLDRVMPRMNGIEFMRLLKRQADVQDIPVVMQTASTKSKEVIEGIEAGVHYYLTKPYDKDLLLSVVAAAYTAYLDLESMRNQLGKIQDVIHLVRNCHFELKTFSEARKLAILLASFFPNPDRRVMGISELLINAIEHGNLGITYAEKTELMSHDTWEKEVETRLALQENQGKVVSVTLIPSDTELTLWIKDMGNGFEWKNYLEISPERATHNHGRGIALSKMISFDQIQYIGRGNEVIAKVFYDKKLSFK